MLAFLLLQRTHADLLENAFDDHNPSAAFFDQRDLQNANACNQILRELPDGCTCVPSSVRGTFRATCNRFCQRCLSTQQVCVTYSLKFEYRRNDANLQYIPRSIEYQASYTGRDSAKVGFSFKTNYDTSFNAQTCTSSIDGKSCLCVVDQSASCVGELRHNCAGVTSGVFEACRREAPLTLNSPFLAFTRAELRIETCGLDILPDPRTAIPPKKSLPDRNKDVLKLSIPADGLRGSLTRKMRSRITMMSV